MNEHFLYDNLITYFGNKRKLLLFINNEILLIKKKLDKELITMLDGFSGTGIVSRLMKYHSKDLYINDIEDYSYLLNTCYLSEPTKNDIKKIRKYIDECNALETNIEGVITKYYSPKDTNNIKKDDRVFYTRENGFIIDTIRNKIETIPIKYQKYILSQLIIKSSINVNTAGHFRSFYKNKHTKIGEFGGTNQNDSKRIRGKIILDYPEFSDQTHKCNVNIYKEDINELILKLPELDIVYYDPPYNDTPYGSNYHLLNTIINNKLGNNISEISGIPQDWKRSNYNKRKKIYDTIYDLLKNTKSKYIILSYNSDGYLSESDLLKIFNELKYKYEKKEFNYVVYKACRNITNRNKDIKEILYILYKDI